MSELNERNKGNLHYYYFKDGGKIKKYKLTYMILDLFDNKEKYTAPEISEKINMDEKTVLYILQNLHRKELLDATATQRHNIYYKKVECRLAELFYPKSKVDQFKVISVQKKTAEDFPNISFGGTRGYESFNGNYNNTVYEGGE